MGAGESTNIFSAGAVIAEANDEEKIFDSNYPEVTFGKQFNSSLFSQVKTSVVKKYILSSNTIVDVLLDPLTLTSQTTMEDTWKNIILPLFSYSDDYKEYYQRLLNEYSRFLRERSNTGFGLEDLRTEQRAEKAQTDNEKVYQKHYQLEEYARLKTRKPIVVIEWFNIENATKDLLLDQAKYFPNTDAIDVNEKFLTVIETTNSVSDLFNGVVYGFWGGNINVLLTAFTRAISFTLIRNTKIFKDSRLQTVFELPKKLDLKISSIHCDTSTFLTSVIIPEIRPLKDIGNSLSCDGSFIYIRDNDGFFQIQISKNVLPNATRVYKRTIKLHQGVTLDNVLPVDGDIFVLTTASTVYICSRTTNDIEPIKTPEPINKHCCTDGHFIYSLKKRTIVIFEYKKESKEFVIARTVTLHRNKKTWDNPSKEHIPETQNLCLYTNGIVITARFSLPTETSYTDRTFSLVDGAFICSKIADESIAWSVTVDLANKAIWGITPGKFEMALRKYRYEGPVGPRFTGLDLSTVPSYNALKVPKSANAEDIATFLDAFFEYSTAHINGSSYNTYLTLDKHYPLDTSLFFAPSVDFIPTLIESIHFFRQVIKGNQGGGQWNAGRFQNVLKMLMRLLDFNIASFKKRVVNGMVVSLDKDLMEKLLKLMIDLSNDQSMAFLKQSIAFTFVNSFEPLTTSNTKLSAQLLGSIIDICDLEFEFFMIKRISECRIFPYAFSSVTMRRGFQKIIKEIGVGTASIKAIEIIDIVMASIIYELRNVYASTSGKFNDEQAQLLDSFQTFSSLLFEVTISNPQKMSSVFIIIFRKYLMLIKSFTKYNRAAIFMVSMIHPVYESLGVMITRVCGNGPKDFDDFTARWALLFDVHTLYTDIIDSILSGGTELDEAKDYLWLVNSTSSSGLKPKHIDKLIPGCFEGQSSGSLKRGLSFRCIGSMSSINVSGAETIISDLIKREPPEYIQNLMEYIYKKAANPLNKRLTEEEKHMERIELATFVKQLGLINVIKGLLDSLSKGETPVMSNFVKQCMDAIYKIRRTLRSIKQTSNALAIKSEEANVDLTSKDITKNYDLFMSTLKKKCVFLIHIEPCNRFVHSEEAGVFNTMIKYIVTFLSMAITLENFFDILDNASKVRSNINMGINMVAQVIKANVFPIGTINFIDRFANSQSIANYFATSYVPGTDPKKIPGYDSSINLLYGLRDMIPICKEGDVEIIILAFFNILNAVSVVAPEIIPGLLIQYTNMIREIKFLQNSYITFGVSYIPIFIANHPEFKTNDEIRQIVQMTCGEEVPIEYRYSIQRLILRTGLEIEGIGDARSIFELLLKSPPNLYHDVASLLLELIPKYSDKLGLIHDILMVISDIASGNPKHFLEEYPLLHEPNVKYSPTIRTAGILMAGCAELIEVIRRLLDSKSEMTTLIKDIFAYILITKSKTNRGRTLPTREGLEIFKESNVLYGVFAVLSNVIQTPRPSSLIKDVLSNKIYYVNSFLPTYNSFLLFSLPVTKDAIPVMLRLSDTLHGISVIPFSVQLFPDYSLLIPFFKQFYLRPQTTYSGEGLAFYVMSCMKEYISNIDFLRQFKQEVSVIKIPNITYQSSLVMFQKVLRSHLYNKENGFQTKSQTDLKFMYASPSDLFNPESFAITDKSITSNSGINYFLTPPLPLDRNTLFSVTFENYPKCVFAGLMTLSTCERVEESLLVRSISGENVVMAKKYHCSTEDSFIIQYDPNERIGTIYDSRQRPIESMRFYNDQIVCYVAFYGKGSITYTISHTLENCCNVPLAGAVFKRGKKPIHGLDEMKSQLTSKNVNSEGALSTILPMKEKFIDVFESVNNCQGLLRYDANTLKAGSTDLVVVNPMKVEMSTPQYQPVYFQHINIHRSNSTYNQKLYLTGTVDSVVDTVTSLDDRIIVDDMTGQNLRVDPSDQKAFTPISECTQINPLWTGILPSEILNFFETGYAIRIRTEISNQMFISALSIPTLKIEDLMHMFDIDYVGLLHHFLSLLVYAEKIFPGILINYDENLLDKHIPPRNAGLHPIKNAIHRILEHIAATDNVQAFADLWYNEVARRFKDGHFHSCIDGHPSAVVIKRREVKEETVLHRPDISAWFICRGGLQKEGIPIACFNDSNGNETFIDGLVYVVRSPTVKLIWNPKSDGTVVAIPFSKFSNESMFGTFVDLAITFKYLVRYIKENEAVIGSDRFVNYKGNLYSLFFDSIIARSPYFITFGINALLFLSQQIPVFGYDLNGVFLQRVNFTSRFVLQDIENPRSSQLGKWIYGMQDLWDERILLPLKAHFPEFCTKNEIEQNESYKNDHIGLPSPPIPWSVEKSANENEIALIVDRISRLFAPRDTIIGWPFFNVIHFWANAAVNIPFCTTRVINQKILEVKFTSSIPDTFTPRFVGSQYNGSMKYSYEESMKNSMVAKDKKITTNGSNTVYIQIDVDWHSLDFFIWSDRKTLPVEEIEKNRDMFVNDVQTMFTRWSPRNDSTILQCFQQSTIESPKLDFTYDPVILFNPRLSGISLPLLVMRANMLLLLNWLVVQKIIDPAKTSDMRHLNKFVSIRLKVSNFLRQIVSRDSMPNITVRRQAAHDLRDGVSRDFGNSYISQVSRNVTPEDLRTKSDRPWHVNFEGEAGIDVGGPARELVTECAEDFMSPNCGLVVPTPNAVNKVGAYTDCFIPFADPNISNSEKLYKTAGAIMGLCMRTGLVQEFQFPPLVWEFLVTNDISIDSIYEIDRNYKLQIESIREALAQGVSEEKFREQFNLNFVVRSVSGREQALTQRGRQTPVTPSNAEEYIANANQFRIGELKPALSALRAGLWANLGTTAQVSLDPAVLEYAACGDKEISYEQLKEITVFNGVAADQQQLFFQVLRQLTPEQRSSLLKFSTGRVRLPPSSSTLKMELKVDCNGAIDTLPTSSTCFHLLHLPRYTSYQNALRMISVAIEFSGTFERA